MWNCLAIPTCAPYRPLFTTTSVLGLLGGSYITFTLHYIYPTLHLPYITFTLHYTILHRNHTLDKVAQLICSTQWFEIELAFVK